MKKFTMSGRIIVIMAVLLVLTIPLFAGGGQSQPASGVSFNRTGMPIVNEKITQRFVTVAYGDTTYNEKTFYQEMEKTTNVNIQFDEVAQSAWTERVQLYFASRDLPDAFYGWLTDSAIIQNYANQGMIIPLDDLVVNYAPNVKKVLFDNQSYYRGNRFPDGKTYSLPTISDAFWNKLANHVFVNQRWLNKLNMKAPATTVEFRDMLRAFRSNNVAVNGINPQFGYSNIRATNGNHALLYGMFGSWGVVDEARHVMLDGNKVIFAANQTGYRQGLEYFNSLYTEGLMDPESFTQDYNELQGKGYNRLPDDTFGDGIGAYVGYRGFWDYQDETQQDKYAVIPPLKGPNGQQIWYDTAEPAGLQLNRFWITNVNKNPEVTIRWMDYIMDNGEMSNRTRNGLPGVRWDWNEKGQWYTIPTPANEDPAIGILAGNYSCVNMVPWFWDASAMANRDISADIDTSMKVVFTNLYMPFVVKAVPHILKYSDTEAREIASLQTDLDSYVMQMQTDFIMNGVTDARWNTYVRTIENYGVARYLQIIQRSYDEYTK